MMLAFSEQARLWSRIAFLQALPLMEAHNRYRPCPYLSSLTRDCISRGKSYYDGGAVYGNRMANVCIVGIATLANSLAAIRKLVFDDKVITMAQLKHALETNFEDTSTNPTGPAIQEMCLRAPKYGNDDPYVDNLAKRLSESIAQGTAEVRDPAGTGPRGHHRSGGGSCDLRHALRGHAGRPQSRDSAERCLFSGSGHGCQRPDGCIKSVANLEHINLVQGTIFNMKMHPGALETHAGMQKWANLIRTYFDLGGWEIQFNVVSAETLREAQKHPERLQGPGGPGGGIQRLLRGAGEGGPGRYHCQNGTRSVMYSPSPLSSPVEGE